MLRKFLALALTAAAAASFGHAAVPSFELRDTHGVVHSASEWKGHKAILLFFVTTDCPVANSYVPEMNRIHQSYGPRGVAVYAVQADTTIPAADVARYAAEYAYGFPLLMDPTQILVRMAQATITPQAAILMPDGRLMYLGRIDNRVADFGTQRPEATVQDLRIALDAVLAGKPVANPRTKSIGCAINRVVP